MTTTILIAKLVAPILLVTAIAMLTNVEGLQEMMREFLRTTLCSTSLEFSRC